MKLPTALMGNDAQDPPQYREEPPDSVSLHSQHDHYEDDVPELDPPAYTDTPTTEFSYEIQERSHPISEFNDMRIISQRNFISQQMNPRFDADPGYVERIVKAWALIPPEPKIQIKGTHTETQSGNNSKKDEKTTVTDFDIKLDLTPYLRNDSTLHGIPWCALLTPENSDKTYRGTSIKRRAAGSKRDIELSSAPKPDLREWCHRYCASHSDLKTFRFERKVTGLNKKYLEEQLTALVRSTNYRGHVSISFPVENRGVEVLSAHWINRLRINGFVCFLFYVTFLWLLTWPYLFFRTKRFAVVHVEWPFSRSFSDAQTLYASVSEQHWFQDWKVAIEKAVLAKRQGPLTEEDRRMVGVQRERVRSGNRQLNTAVEWLIAGAAGVSEAQRALGWGRDS